MNSHSLVQRLIGVSSSRRQWLFGAMDCRDRRQGHRRPGFHPKHLDGRGETGPFWPSSAMNNHPRSISTAVMEAAGDLILALHDPRHTQESLFQCLVEGTQRLVPHTTFIVACTDRQEAKLTTYL